MFFERIVCLQVSTYPRLERFWTERVACEEAQVL